MDAKTDFDLGKLHQAIANEVQTQFPIFQIVEAYRETHERKLHASELPAFLFELSEMEADPECDPGTEQLAVIGRFEARILMSFKEPSAKLAIRKLAADVAAWLRLRRWRDPDDLTKGIPTGPAQLVGLYRDDFHAELDQFEVWRIEWDCLMHLGVGIYPLQGPRPTEVYTSFVPIVGIPYKDYYFKLTP